MKNNRLEAVCSDGLKVQAKLDGQYDYILDYASDGHKPVGTNPGGALILALAGCKTMVVRSYLLSQGKDYPVKVSIAAEKNKDNGSYAMDFDVDLTIEGELTDEETDEELDKIKARVEERCAVKQIILNPDNTVTTHYHKQ